MTICNHCGHENRDDLETCEACGNSLGKSAISLVGEFQLQLAGKNRVVIQLDAPQVEGYIIGRTDEGSDYLPDIDLGDYGGRELGVSRRHAALVVYRGIVHVLDLNSVNGTYLNGQRLLPDTPYPLNVGDKLRLGNMSLALMPGEK